MARHDRRIVLRKRRNDPPGEKLVAVSGGADSVYLSHRLSEEGDLFAIGHVNHGLRGKESDRDQDFVEDLAARLCVPFESCRTGRIGTLENKGSPARRSRPGIEETARRERYDALMKMCRGRGDAALLTAHTADDQVETILMRIFEGAGIAGLKGIPDETPRGIHRPILHVWRDDILRDLARRGIGYRVDRSNFDTTFERNWIRHVLVPLLEKRYGPGVKKRIHALGERFREIDLFLDGAAGRWMRRNLREAEGERALILPRVVFGRLPSALRKRIVQRICFERVGVAPNERLLESMDRQIVSGKPSGRLSIGRGATLSCRYGEAVFTPPGVPLKPSPDEGSGGKGTSRGRGIRSGAERTGRAASVLAGGRKAAASPAKSASGGGKPALPAGVGIPFLMDRPGRHARPSAGETAGTESPRAFIWEERGRISPSRVRRMAEGERAAAFDKGDLPAPLSVRPLRKGDRIRPFGLGEEKKVKEILIDRKVPRGERWGRPAVCDARGRIVWIPGVARSSIAPVTPRTRRIVVLRTG